MFILYAIVIGVVVGFAFRGRLERLGDIPFRWPWLAVAGLLFQVALFSESVGRAFGGLAPAAYVASTAAVFLAVVRNVRLPGLPLVAAGAASNLAAIVANGGYMPASADALASLGRATVGTYTNSRVDATPNLAPLTDIFALPAGLPLANVFSIGDVLIALGIGATIVLAMRRQPAATTPDG